MAKTRRVVRRRRTRRKSSRGGKLIGVGFEGHVHYGRSDHVRCKDGSEWKEDDVAKVGKDLSEEMEKVNAIRKIYPEISEFAILASRVCEMKQEDYDAHLAAQPDSFAKEMFENREGTPQILFAPYGGETLKDVPPSKKVVAALKVLLTQVEEMNRRGIRHQDIGDGNIVYRNGKAFLIDFGSSYIESNTDEVYDGDTRMLQNVIDEMETKVRGGSRRKHFQRSRS